MLGILAFVLSDFWIWLGTVILILAVYKIVLEA